MSHFETYGYEIRKKAVSEETCKLLSYEFEMLKDNYYLSNKISAENKFVKNDVQVEKSFSWYGAYCFESLLMLMKPHVEEITAKKLYPTYSYARIYYNGAEMEKHRDRPSCQYSATVTIECEKDPWDIWFTDFKNNTKPLKLYTGDICVYRGDQLDHWRDKFDGQKQIQAFLHYVDSEGEFADKKYDGRKILGSSYDMV
jgi:hypothetical protein